MNELLESNLLNKIKEKDIIIKDRSINFNNDVTSKNKLLSEYYRENKINNRLLIKNCEIFIHKMYSKTFDIYNLIKIKDSRIHISYIIIDMDSPNYEFIRDEFISNNKFFISKTYIVGHNITMEKIKEELSNINSESICIKDSLKSSYTVPNVQNDFNVEYVDCARGKINNIFPPFTKTVKLRDNSGEMQFYGNELYLDNNEYVDLEIKPGSTIYIERPVNELNIKCAGKFNIYFATKNVANMTKINILNGKISKTNNRDLILANKSKLHKFEVFVNVDFTKEDIIQEFYACTFYNCCFNSNQMIIDSKIKKSFFLDKNVNVHNCEVDLVKLSATN